MRRGAAPLLAWGTILAVLYAGHAIWDGRTVPTLTTAFAVIVIYGFAAALWLLGGRQQRAQPAASLAAVVAGLSFACILFGVVWSSFLVYFGAGMLLLSGGRVVVELRAQRETERRAQR